MKVIDLSENNGDIDLRMIKEEGIDNVILRLCWIGNKNNHTKDKLIDYYYTQAKIYNMKIGFYVYSYCESVENLKLALNYIDNILNELNAKNNEIYLDLEDKQISGLSKENLTEQAKYFCNYYKEKGYKSGIYANLDWFKNKLEYNELKNYKIWLAEWNVTKPSIECDLWQYTDNLIINNKRFDCSYIINENEDEKKEGEFEVKDYENGSTIEYVYQDDHDFKQIGYLHPYETAKCYGIVNNRALIVYTVDGTTSKKSGFVKWLGGIK